MEMIKRHAGSAIGRSRAVEYGELVFTVGTSSERGDDVREQTQVTLAAIEQNLSDAGSSKTRILSATVYLADISQKSQMDEVWCEWIGSADNWPQRACVQAHLAAKTLVEITIIAAKH